MTAKRSGDAEDFSKDLTFNLRRYSTNAVINPAINKKY